MCFALRSLIQSIIAASVVGVAVQRCELSVQPDDRRGADLQVQVRRTRALEDRDEVLDPETGSGGEILRSHLLATIVSYGLPLRHVPPSFPVIGVTSPSL